jgi:ribose transport system ATP-binding protein
MLLRMRGISKSFDSNPALSNANLDLAGGEVLGIIGENGAGKSTLIRSLAGAHLVDSGEIEIEGQSVHLRSPAESIAAGVAVIYQELTIVPELTIAENVFLGNVPRKGPVIDRSLMNEQAATLLKRLGLKLHPGHRAGDLAPGYQQMVEIARAINRNAKILLMDEPTSYLSEHEVGRLFEFIAQLKSQGLGIIYISHHLEEIFKVCDHVIVLRDGKTVATGPIGTWTSKNLVEAMVNRSIDQFYPYTPRSLGDVALSVRDIDVPGQLSGISFDLHKGEILGIAGVVGSGRTELLKVLFGALPHSRGQIVWNGEPFVPKSPSHAIANRVVMVPEDRKIDGLLLDASIENNVSLSVLHRLSYAGFVSNSRKRKLAEEGIKRFRVACRGPGTRIRNLSGGNQQKVIFARITAVDPLLYLLDEPTRGVDVGAKVEVYKQIIHFAESGASILLVSSELPELLGLSDRVLVLNGGRLVGNLVRAAATHERVLALSTEEHPATEIVQISE